MGPVTAALFVLLILAIVAGGFVVLFLILRTVLSGRGRGGVLAQRYPASGEPPGQNLRRQTITIGLTQYRNSATVIVSPAGFYCKPWFAVAAFLVPWTEIRSVRSAMLYLQPAMELSVGSPEVAAIRIRPQVFALMRPYLATAVQRGPV